MPVRGSKPADGPKHFRGQPTHEWHDVEDRPYTGKVPVALPTKRDLPTKTGTVSVPLHTMTKAWWRTVRRMPHCRLWSDSDWLFAVATALVADLAFRGSTGASTELRQREKVLGVTVDARRDLRIRYVTPKPVKKQAARKAKSSRPAAGTVTSLEDRRRRLTSAS